MDKTGQSFFWKGRILVWFSCGAASAVAAKLACEKYHNDNLEILYCDTLKYESDDNRRFMSDVSCWIGREIKILRSEKYSDIMEVFRGERCLNTPHGAPCTRALKRNVRRAYELPEDVQIFGFTADEESRITDFKLDNPDMDCEFILQDHGITKRDCYHIIKNAGIDIPLLYRQGFRNNNCIGCVKGGAGYWNLVRKLYPERFYEMANLELELKFALLRVKGRPCFLHDLPADCGNYKGEPDIECGPQCTRPAA